MIPNTIGARRWHLDCAEKCSAWSRGGVPLYQFGYTPTADGQRFLVNVPAAGEEAETAPITVVLNWQAGLGR